MNAALSKAIADARAALDRVELLARPQATPADYRLAAGFKTPESLASVARVNVRTIRKYEAGRVQRIRAEVLDRFSLIARVLRIDAADYQAAVERARA